MTRYVAHYRREPSGAWIVTVPSVPGCHTYGRTLEQARGRIREALGLFDKNAARAVLADRIALPAEARALLKRAKHTRSKALAESRRASKVTTEAVNYLTKELGLSTRDAGQLLDLSHQRVQQLGSARVARGSR